MVWYINQFFLYHSRLLCRGLIPAWTSNYTHDKIWDGVIYPLQNYHIAFAEVWNGHEISSHITMGRGVTIRLATIRYISRYTTHDMVHDTIQNQLIYYQWKILKHCGMCHQYCYIKTVILARNSEFKIIKMYIIIHAPNTYFWQIVFVNRTIKSHNRK